MGLWDYAKYQDSFSIVATMHNTSYQAGILGGLLMTYYIYTKRPPAAQVLRWQPSGLILEIGIYLRNKQNTAR